MRLGLGLGLGLRRTEGARVETRSVRHGGDELGGQEGEPPIGRLVGWELGLGLGLGAIGVGVGVRVGVRVRVGVGVGVGVRVRAIGSCALASTVIGWLSCTASSAPSISPMSTPAMPGSRESGWYAPAASRLASAMTLSCSMGSILW